MSNSTDHARHWFMSDAAKRDKIKFRRLLGLVYPEHPDRYEAEDLLAGRIDRLFSYCELHQVRNFESLREVAEATLVPIKVIEAMASPTVMWIRHVKPSPDIIEARRVQGLTSTDITRPMAVVRMWSNGRGGVSAARDKANVKAGSEHIPTDLHDEQEGLGPSGDPEPSASNGLAGGEQGGIERSQKSRRPRLDDAIKEQKLQAAAGATA